MLPATLNDQDPRDDTLLFRRQFVMGPSFVRDLPGWKRFSVDSSHHLTVHPDLGAVQVKEGTSSVTLLGYMLDPDAPSAGDEEIARRLLGQVTRGGWQSLIAATANLAGRWILVMNDGRRVRVFTDPCGYRQVVFTRAPGDGLWCASQPGLLAELLGLEPSSEGMDFVRRYRETVPGWRGAEYWWPGDTTPFREIRHLLPNHYLDLTDGEVRRFWPDAPLTPLPFEEAVERNVHLLRGIVQSASRRFDLALTVTAGRDTRLLLAATRPIADRVFYFTLKYWDLNDAGSDIVIPRRLLAKLGLDHRLIECPTVMEPSFERLYEKNVSTAHDSYGIIAQGLWRDYPAARVCMKGTASFAMHNFDRFRDEHPPRRAIEADDLLRFARLREYPFAVDAIKRWSAGASPAHDVDPLSLFFWENKEGKWQASAHLEWDIVQEVLVPYNCRSFMTNALSVDARLRSGPTHYFQRTLTARLWPEVLSEPINAVSWPGGPARRAIRDFLVRRGLHRRVRQARRILGMSGKRR